MYDIDDNPLGKMRYYVGALFIITSLIFTAVLIYIIATENPSATSTSVIKEYATLGATARDMGHGLQKTGKIVRHGIGSGASAVGNAVYVSTVYTIRGIALAVASPLQAVSSASNTAVVRAVISPDASSSLPVIDGSATALSSSEKPLSALPLGNQAAAVVTPEPQSVWPIHGAITTEFGVPEPPYQPIHTGLDISDGNRVGTSPVVAFRAGSVVSVIHSYVGLGNHVVVDHGNGLTSVYAHLYATNVVIGQPVLAGTIIGIEGTTGASTGPHVHFEIRQDGVAMNPKNYIVGLP